MQIKFKVSQISGIIVFVLLFVAVVVLNKPHNPERLTRNVQAKIKTYEKEMEHQLSFVQSVFYDEFLTTTEKAEKILKYSHEELIVLVYQNDSLVFWTDHDFPELLVLPSLSIEDGFLFASANGWYYVRCQKVEADLLVALFLVKSNYAYENHFLENDFNSVLGLGNRHADLSVGEGLHNIYNSSGKHLFSLDFTGDMEHCESTQKILFILYLALILFAAVWLVKLLNYLFGKHLHPVLLQGLIILLLVFLRFATFYYNVPTSFYALDLFSPHLFAASLWLPSLGDLFLNALLIFGIVWIVNGLLKKSEAGLPYKKWQKFLKIILPGLAAILLFVISFDILKSLIINSNIYFLFNNFYDFSFYSFLGIAIPGLMLYAFHLMAVRFVKAIAVTWTTSYVFLAFAGFFVIVALLVDFKVVILAVLCIYFLTLFYYTKKLYSLNKFTVLILCVLLISLPVTSSVYRYAEVKEKDRRKLLVNNLATDRDPLAEFLFYEISTDISTDSILRSYLTKHIENEDAIQTHLKQNYFFGFWDKYDMQVTVCAPYEKLMIRPENVEVFCLDFFKDMIAGFGRPTDSPFLFHLDFLTGRSAYLADIPIYFEEENIYITIFIEFFSKFVPKQIGYPELLIDKNVRLNKAIFDYDYAKYQNGNLIQQYGKFNYYTDISSYNFKRNTYTFFDYGGFSKLYYNANDDLEIIISKAKPSIIDALASFSYIFVIFTLLWLLVRAICFPDKRALKISAHFSERIKVAMVSIVVVSFIVIGVVTLRFIVNIYNNKNYDNISEKAHSILIELENEMMHLDRIKPEMHHYAYETLIKLSGVFFTDINLYDINGRLIASSREKIFNEGLVGEVMHPEAFFNMTHKRKTFFVHNEHIGTLKYLSAYMPFRNINGECIAYINLPYFAQQSEQRREIASFSATFVNILVFLIALAVMVALLLSKYVSKPLMMIKDKLSRFELGKVNEKIQWRKDDEIGSLVHEYNRLIDELEKSAQMLARSERESAWREMAKQVAHEIKNPLTPMKLRVQHLYKTWLDKPENFDDNLKNFSQMMIDQINTLSDIATSFSDFAKMPSFKNSFIDLTKLVEDVVSVYRDITDVDIVFEASEKQPLWVLADEKQLKRAVNNLLKNALQAVESCKEPRVQIFIESEKDIYVIKIIDNGQGIHEDIAKKIFLPSFTTKTSGMGLGLAIVKSIIESFNGHVYFESAEGKGATFFVVLPKGKTSNAS